MLTKEYRFSLIFPPLLICSFDLPDSTIQIIRAVPVFRATNVMPKLNQTKVFKEEKNKKINKSVHLKSFSSPCLSSWAWGKQASQRQAHQVPSITSVFRRHLWAQSASLQAGKLLKVNFSSRGSSFGSWVGAKQAIALAFYPHCLLVSSLAPARLSSGCALRTSIWLHACFSGLLGIRL